MARADTTTNGSRGRRPVQQSSAGSLLAGDSAPRGLRTSTKSHNLPSEHVAESLSAHHRPASRAPTSADPIPVSQAKPQLAIGPPTAVKVTQKHSGPLTWHRVTLLTTLLSSSPGAAMKRDMRVYLLLGSSRTRSRQVLAPAESHPASQQVLVGFRAGGRCRSDLASFRRGPIEAVPLQDESSHASCRAGALLHEIAGEALASSDTASRVGADVVLVEATVGHRVDTPAAPNAPARSGIHPTTWNTSDWIQYDHGQ